jgi:uncharacterized membrane protein
VNSLYTAGRALFGASIAAFGVQYLQYGRFLGGLPPVPPWTPGGKPAVYLVGVILIAVGARIALNRQPRSAAQVLGWLFFLCVVILQGPHIKEIVYQGTARTRALEPLALAGVAWALAGMLSAPAPGSHSRANPSRIATFGRWLFAFCMVIFGIQHFLYAAFIATLIPSWIPGHLIWVYFTGIGFIAAALAILVNIGHRLAAFMLGVMFLLWVVVLHAPRVAASPHNGDEWSSLFVALALGGGALILAHATALPDRA